MSRELALGYPSGFHRPSARCSSLIRSRFALAAARFPSCVLERCCLRHLSTRILASLQAPEALCMKPCAWHSSRAAITSWHAGCSLLAHWKESDALEEHWTYPWHSVCASEDAFSVACVTLRLGGCRVRPSQWKRYGLMDSLISRCLNCIEKSLGRSSGRI